MRKIKDNLFDDIDKDLAKLGKVSRSYSDDDNVTITTDYSTYKENRSMLDGIMGDYGYEFYDLGGNGDKVMLTYNKVSDSRRVKDSVDLEDYKVNVTDLDSYSKKTIGFEEFFNYPQSKKFWMKDFLNGVADYSEKIDDAVVISARGNSYFIEFISESTDAHILFSIIGLNKPSMSIANAMEKYLMEHMSKDVFVDKDPYKTWNMNTNVFDSRRVKDSDDEYLLQEIARQLEEGYHAGYEPQWDIDITVDGMDISEFDDYDKDLIYMAIAYVVGEGYDNYNDIEIELSDGSIAFVDFVLNY
jgi:hypothetical protein